MKHKWIALCLAAVLCAAPGCGRAAEQSGEAPQQSASADSGTAPAVQEPVSDTLRVAYNNADSLEPYRLYSTMNQNLISLLYDPLVKLDRDYAPRNVLAADVSVQGLTCVVTLKTGVVFSDGSPLTAQDVVYSAQQVRAGAGPYKGQLANVTEVTAREDGAVVFTLAKPDRLFANLLTFPIVREESPAVGCGRFVLSASGEERRLMANPRWHGGNTGRIKTVELVNQLDKDTLIYSLKLGTINYAYSDPTGMESVSLGVSTQEVPLNQMIYLGLNSTKGELALPAMRSAINQVVDRATLANQIYGSRAVPAYTPFNPRAREVAPQGYTVARDLKAAQELLAGAGYTQRDSEGYYVTQKGRVRMRLLVNVDNTSRMQTAQAIQRSLKELGVEVTIDGRLYDDYRTALASGDFELYLGTTRLYDNMDLSFMLSPQGAVGYGVPTVPELQSANDALMAGTMSTQDFTDIFYDTTPFVPLMYRSAVVAFSRGAYFDAQATEQDIFFNIENW